MKVEYQERTSLLANQDFALEVSEFSICCGKKKCCKKYKKKGKPCKSCPKF